MSKHTPRPWRVVKDEEMPGAYRIDGFYSMIEDAYESNDPQSVVAMNQEDDANAKLIAAAPELLEAARLALRTFDTSETVNDQHDGEVLNVLEDAITKATGG